MYRLVGALIGYYFFGIFGAFIGYFLGSIVTRYSAYGMGAINPLGNAHRKAVFLETVFVLMGKLAKADGHISKDEIAHAELFMQRMGMTAGHRQQAIALFKRGAAPDFAIEPSVRQFMAACGHTHSLKQMLLTYLIVMALSDGRIDTTEENLLIEIARHLGYSQEVFQHLLEMVLNQSHFSGGQAPSSASALDDAYKALGVSRESSDLDVKRAYRKLMSQYHPDKLMGQGVPQDMIAVATVQAQEVQVAYDLIKKSREQ